MNILGIGENSPCFQVSMPTTKVPNLVALSLGFGYPYKTPVRGTSYSYTLDLGVLFALFRYPK